MIEALAHHRASPGATAGRPAAESPARIVVPQAAELDDVDDTDHRSPAVGHHSITARRSISALASQGVEKGGAHPSTGLTKLSSLNFLTLVQC